MSSTGQQYRSKSSHLSWVRPTTCPVYDNQFVSFRSVYSQTLCFIFCQTPVTLLFGVLLSEGRLWEWIRKQEAVKESWRSELHVRVLVAGSQSWSPSLNPCPTKQYWGLIDLTWAPVLSFMFMWVVQFFLGYIAMVTYGQNKRSV